MFVADTHSLIWYLTEDDELSDSARQIFRQADKGQVTVVIPTIVLAEAMFISDKSGASFSKLTEKLEKGTNYEVYPLNMKVIHEMREIENDYSIHDKAIIATSELLEATTITKDKKIREGNTETIW